MNRFSDFLIIQPPAKLNLYFEVSRRLPTGFHEILSLVTPISIHDTLRVHSASRLSLTVEIPPEEKFRRLFAGKTIPTDESNLVLRAARLLCEYAVKKGVRTSGDLPGADIILTKRIPSEAGLGGGSSDAAAVLLVLNQLWELSFSRNELIEVGAELGSDVPLFLTGFPVICRGRGEKLEAVPEGESFPVLYFVVARPFAGCSTPAVYQRCTPQGPQKDSVITEMLSAWREHNLELFSKGLRNRLTEPAIQVAPEVKRTLDVLSSVPDPLLGVSMTGSGSACFGLCRNRTHSLETAKFLESTFAGTVFTAETELFPLTPRL